MSAAGGADAVGRLVDHVRDELARRELGGQDGVAGVLAASGAVLGSAALPEVARAVRAELFGAGPLQPLLDDPDVTDVLVNPDGAVWVDRAGQGLVRACRALAAGQVRARAVRLAAAGGRRLDDQSPTVDARLADGTRVHAVLGPLCDGAAAISLRTHRPRPFTLESLVARGAVAPHWADELADVVARRANVLVSGATGTGNTTWHL